VGSEIWQRVNNNLQILGEGTRDLSIGSSKKTPVVSAYYISLSELWHDIC
jgi:hypothetical protein